MGEKHHGAVRSLIESRDLVGLQRLQGRIQGLEEALTMRDVLLAKPVRRPQ